MRTQFKSLVIGGLALASLSQAFAREAPQATGNVLGWGKPSLQGATFDPNFKVGFKGKVVGVEIYPIEKGGPLKVDALVKLKNGGTALVDLGPKAWLDQHHIKIRVKDTLYVAGSKVFINGLSVILPSKINRGGVKVALRNSSGQPAWDAATPKVN